MCIYVYVFLTAQVPGFLGLRLQARLPFLRCSSGLALLQTNFDSYQVKKDSLCKPFVEFFQLLRPQLRFAMPHSSTSKIIANSLQCSQSNRTIFWRYLEVMFPARWQSLQLLLASVWIVAIVTRLVVLWALRLNSLRRPTEVYDDYGHNLWSRFCTWSHPESTFCCHSIYLRDYRSFNYRIKINIHKASFNVACAKCLSQAT